ncbi:MAG: hypothetical protein ACR2KT_09780 [Methylocella sp.]|nr:MAG: hypothetical protein DLM68_01005 [Hyphomicrobiales bacterium]
MIASDQSSKLSFLSKPAARTSVLSFQAGLRSPGGSFADSLGPFEVRRAASLDLRGLAGHNVVVAEMEGFVDAQGGYRFYAGNQPGEYRIDLTMGLRPWPRLLVVPFRNRPGSLTVAAIALAPIMPTPGTLARSLLSRLGRPPLPGIDVP